MSWKTVDNDIYLTRGDTVPMPVTLTSKSDSTVRYIPETGKDTLIFTVKKSTSDKTAIITKSLAAGDITFDSAGNGVISILPADTASLDYGIYYYDLQLTTPDAAGVQTVITPSIFKVCEEVTF
jgi:hypothetical protein